VQIVVTERDRRELEAHYWTLVCRAPFTRTYRRILRDQLVAQHLDRLRKTGDGLAGSGGAGDGSKGEAPLPQHVP
jgi:hypothetical protein